MTGCSVPPALARRREHLFSCHARNRGINRGTVRSAGLCSVPLFGMILPSITSPAPRFLLCALSIMAGLVADGGAAETFSAAPFTARIKGSGMALFSPVEAGVSGLKHAPQVHNENPLSYMYHSGFVCGGVAA